jgi:predicted aminopeptidase
MATLGLLGTLALAAATLCLTSGCSSIGYLAQSAQGHFALLSSAQPVDQLLSQPGTTPELRERLALTQRMRDYAVAELKLPDNGSYRKYADLGRNAVVWNVVAAPELSLQLKTWCFPVVGCVGYRGYFDRTGADQLAAELRGQGYDVSVYGVPAYSSLGWFDDPLLNTFIRYPEGELARMLFHELAHQVAYASGDTEFNESFATAVERLGGSRWLSERASPAAREEYQRFDTRRQAFRELTMRWRHRFEAVYASKRPDEEKRLAKAALMQEMRAEYEQLKAGPFGGYAGFDGWFERANNASLGVLAAYNTLVPAFEALFEAEGRDFGRFYAEVKRLAALPKDERRATLQRYLH